MSNFGTFDITPEQRCEVSDGNNNGSFRSAADAESASATNKRGYLQAQYNQWD
jgi:hypothetical protein